MTSSSTQRTGRTPRRPSRLRAFVKVLQVCILLGMSATCGIALALFIGSYNKLPNVGNFEPSEATLIYSSDGQILGRIYREDRTNVPLKDIPESLREATVAIEDSRFYKHSGIDMRGIARAIWSNVRKQKLAEGASTITQQLARSVYLTQDKSAQRKIQEAVIAILLERKFTKDKILELYMNQVYYGSGAFGVQAASRVYFGKDVRELNLSEAAMIAGMPQRPSGYSPHKDIEAATGRRNMVLAKMAELNFIDSEQRDEAKAEKLKVVPRASGRNTYKAPHFVDYVVNQLKERYGDEEILYKGLRVYTTLNYEMQKAAEKGLRDSVKKHEKLRHVSEGCFIAIEPGNGYIRAMVGSVDSHSQYNRSAQAHRQPGSSFKPFVYTAALMAGMRPNDTVSNSAYHSHDGKWNPKNYDGKFGGNVTIATAIAQSMNMPAIRTAEKVGIKNVIKYANLMGVGLDPEYPLDPYLPTAIGGVKGLTPLEMASAYCTFANDGTHVDACSIIRVTNSRGETIEDYVPEGRRVIPKHINDMMDDLLRGVVEKGTGRPARAISKARGKTGTTNNDVDAWFIGYVPHKLVAACWVGNDNNAPMKGAYGSVVCAPAWVDFMKKAIPIYDKVHAATNPKPKTIAKSADDTDAAKKPKKPKDTHSEEPLIVTDENGDTVPVTICEQSKLLATKNCPSTHSENFLRGTEPKTYCGIHTGDNSSSDDSAKQETSLVTVKICGDTGQLAGTGCPNTVRKRIPADSVPSQECTMHNH